MPDAPPAPVPNPPSLNLVALESRVTELEKALASYIAPKLGAIEHDSHAAAQSWLEKVKGFFAKPAAPKPEIEPPASGPGTAGTSPPLPPA